MTISSSSASNISVEALEGVGSARAKHLRILGVRTLGELLEYFPSRYQYESEERPIERLVKEQIQTARGRVVACDVVPVGRPRFEATIDDGTEKLPLVWFNGTWLRKKIVPGMMIRVQGKVKWRGNMPQMVNPKWHEITEEAERVETSSFRPIYPATAKLPSETIHQII